MDVHVFFLFWEGISNFFLLDWELGGTERGWGWLPIRQWWRATQLVFRETWKGNHVIHHKFVSQKHPQFFHSKLRELTMYRLYPYFFPLKTQIKLKIHWKKPEKKHENKSKHLLNTSTKSPWQKSTPLKKLGMFAFWFPLKSKNSSELLGVASKPGGRLPGLPSRLAAPVVCDGHWACGHGAASGGVDRGPGGRVAGEAQQQMDQDVGVSKNSGCFPQNGWFIMENPIKMGWFEGGTLFLEISICFFW